MTTWEGIHFCARCLADRRTAAHRSSPWPTWVVLGLAIAVLLTLHSRVLAWFGVLVAGLR